MSRKKRVRIRPASVPEMERVTMKEGLDWWNQQMQAAHQARLKRAKEEEEARKRANRERVRNKKGPGKGHCWPMRSEALAVHPDQVDEANERNKKHGIAARYEPGTGMCVIEDNGARRKLLRVEGAIDRSGYC